MDNLMRKIKMPRLHWYQRFFKETTENKHLKQKHWNTLCKDTVKGDINVLSRRHCNITLHTVQKLRGQYCQSAMAESHMAFESQLVHICSSFLLMAWEMQCMKVQVLGPLPSTWERQKKLLALHFAHAQSQLLWPSEGVNMWIENLAHFLFSPSPTSLIFLLSNK